MDESSGILPSELSARPPGIWMSATPGTKNLQIFTAHDWEDQKENITRLYVEEDRTLKEVMFLIQHQYGLHATERMYKSRIKKWRLDKNNKLNEMTSVVRIQHQRKNDGKRTRFRIRGRPIDLAEVDRYLKRRRLRHQASPVLSTSDIGTPSELSYSTVTPRDRSDSFSMTSEQTALESFFDPALTNSRTDEASFDEINLLRLFSLSPDDLEKRVQTLGPLLLEATQRQNSELMALPHFPWSEASPFDSFQAQYSQGSTTSVPLSPPLSTLDPSRFLTGLHYYLSSLIGEDTKQDHTLISKTSSKKSPSVRAFATDYPVLKLVATLSLDNPNTFFYLCHTASTLWTNNRPHEAVLLLDQASEMLGFLLSKKRLATCAALLSSVASFESQHQPELTDRLLELASGMSATMLGATHPMTVMCQCLLSSSARIAVCRMSMIQLSEICSSVKGDDDSDTVHIRYELGVLLDSLEETDLAKATFENVLLGCGNNSSLAACCIYYIASTCLSQGELSQAHAMTQDLLEREQRSGRAYSQSLKHECRVLEASILYSQDDFDAALQMMTMVFEDSARAFGGQDPITLYCEAQIDFIRTAMPVL